MTQTQLRDLAKRMTPEDFDTLLRIYVQNQKDRLKDSTKNFSFLDFTVYGHSDDPKWRLVLGNGSAGQTISGDMLAVCVDDAIEMARRAQSNTLKLLAPPVDVTAADDEIPF